MTPLLTVGLPVYNSADYLAECVESIKRQTLTEFVVLAVLDQPTDHSAELMRRHADSRFQIIENDKNIGLAATCNRMLQMCETDLLARMDADDVMHPERLAKQYAFMQGHPEIDVLGTYFDIMDETGAIKADPHPFCTTPDELREEFRIYVALHHPTLVYRVARLLELGGYPDSRVSEDSILWLKALAHNYKFANLPEVLLSYRVHRAQAMNRLREPSFLALEKAYATYGKQIWGDRAPDYICGATRLERLKRRMKRNITRLISR
ncbi:MAG: glycosyltransferase [bacterium]|nr:glycosyltransferase [bacterium]